MADMSQWERRMKELDEQNRQNNNTVVTPVNNTPVTPQSPSTPVSSPTPSSSTPAAAKTPIAYTNPATGGTEYYTPTDNPNIGVDASGNRVYIGGYVQGGYTSENTQAIENPVVPMQSSPDAEYTGLSTAQGGTWGKTPETLAQQAFAGGQIEYTVSNPDGTTREATAVEAQQMTQQSIANMTSQQKEQYKVALAELESAPGSTPEEKLAYVQKTTSENALAIPVSERKVLDLGTKLTDAQIASLNEKNLPVEQATIKTASEPGMTTNISQESYKLLEPKYRDILDKQGYDAFEKEYAKDHVKLADGTYVTNATWAHLSKEDQQFIIDKGYDAYIDRENSKAIKLKDGSSISQSQYDSLPPKMQEALKKDGFEAINLSKLSPEDQFKKMQEWEMIPKDAEFGGVDKDGNITYKPSDKEVKEAAPWYKQVWESMTPWDEGKGETATLEGSVTMAAETLVPFVYSIRNWDKMSDSEKAMSLGMDIVSTGLILIPAVRGVSTAIRMGMEVPEALARGAGRVAAEVTYRQVTDPVRMLMHPIETVKAPFRFFKEIAGGKTVPYEAHFRGVAGGEGGSDLKIKIGGGNEMAGATLEGVNELTKAGIAGTKAETLVGTQLVKFSNTGFEKIAGRPVQTHSSPGIEKFLQEVDETGVVTVKGNDKEAALFSSVGGTEFWRQSATGGMGQIPGGLHIEGDVEMLSDKVAKLRDPAKTQEAMVKMAKDDKLANTATVGSKSYHNTIEFESMQWENSKLKPVMTDKPKTFKWKEPEAALSAKSAELMQMAAQAEKMAKQSKTVQEAAVHLKNSDKLAKQSVETYKEAVKKGVQKQVTTNVDYLESIDPITGQNLIFLHMVQEGQEVMAKPWTKAQIAGWKVKGFMNIPRDIFVPALQKPKMSPEKLITEVGKRLNQPERNRLADGLELMDILSKQKVNPKKFATVSMSDVEMIPKESAKEIDKWFAMHDHRLYGSMVEWTQARTPFTIKPNDLDFALNDPEKGINEIADIIRRTSDIKITVEPARLGGAGAVIRNSKGEIIIEGHSMIEHLHDLPFGMPVSKPTVQAGIFKQEQLSEQLMRRGNALLMPGFGPQGRQAFGPEAAAMYKRMKDYGKFGDASVELIASMREEAKNLSGLAKKTKLAEADRAEVLLKNFIKKPSVADLKAAGLDVKATLDQYYETIGKKFNATAEEINPLPDPNADLNKYSATYKKNADAIMAKMPEPIATASVADLEWKGIKQQFSPDQVQQTKAYLVSSRKEGGWSKEIADAFQDNAKFHKEKNPEYVNAMLTRSNELLRKYNMPEIIIDDFEVADNYIFSAAQAGGFYDPETTKIYIPLTSFMENGRIGNKNAAEVLLHESWHKIHYDEFGKLITAEKRPEMEKLVKELAVKHPDSSEFLIWDNIKKAITELGAERATDRLLQKPRMANAEFEKHREFWRDFYMADFIKAFGKDEYLKIEKFAQKTADDYINAKGIEHIPWKGKDPAKVNMIPPKMKGAVDDAIERYVGEYRKRNLAKEALNYRGNSSVVTAGRISKKVSGTEFRTPEKTTSDRISATRITPDRIATERITSDRVSPRRTVPDRVAPDRITPDRASLRRTSPDRVTPDRTTPDRIAPDRVTPDRITPDRVTPDRITPERTTPERTTPDRITPDRIRPERITPDRNMPRISRKAIIFIQNNSEHKNLDPKQFEGMLAWRQGLFYQIRWKPFGANDVFYSREPIPGVKYHEGLGSAAKSAVALYGEVPQNVRVDMGIVDINITRTSDIRKPNLGFKADLKQKTKYTGIVKSKSESSLKKSK